MREPIEQGAGQPLGTEDAGPFVEGQVGGDDSGAALIEQKLGAGRREQALLIARFDQFMNESRGCRETDVSVAV